MKTIEQSSPGEKDALSNDKSCTSQTDDLNISNFLKVDWNIDTLLAKLLVGAICKHYKNSATQTGPVGREDTHLNAGQKQSDNTDEHNGDTGHTSIDGLNGPNDHKSHGDHSSHNRYNCHNANNRARKKGKQNGTAVANSAPGPTTTFSTVSSPDTPSSGFGTISSTFSDLDDPDEKYSSHSQALGDTFCATE